MNEHQKHFETLIAGRYKGQNGSTKRVRREKRFIRKEIYKAVGSHCRNRPSVDDYPIPYSIFRNAYDYACWLLLRRRMVGHREGRRERELNKTF